MITRFLDWLRGERCHGCTTRIFPRDAVHHYATECPAVNR